MRKTTLKMTKVLLPSGKPSFCITAPKPGGGRTRRFFPTREEARTFLELSKVALANHGAASLSLNDALRSEAVWADGQLRPLGKSIRDAVEFYMRHLTRDSASVPVARAVAELVEAKRHAGRSPLYLADIGARLGRFARTYAARPVSSFDAKELDAYLVGLGRAAGTRNTHRRDLGTLFSFAERRGYLTANPVAHTERATVADKPVEILTVRQAGALLNACASDVLPFFAIGLFAGLRTCELKQLDWQRVDLHAGHIEVSAKSSKTRARRLVPITPNLAAWLLPLAQPAGPIAPAGLRHRLNAVRLAAGLAEWPSNAMRHSYGSYRTALTGDAARVSLEMGNSASVVFAHYRAVVSSAEAERYFAIAPQPVANVVSIAA